MLADSFVRRGLEENEFWIGSYFCPAATVRERLEGYVIADDVRIEDQTEAWAAVSVLGLDLGRLAALAESEGALVFGGRRDRDGSLECAYPVARGVPASVATLIAGVCELSRDDVERRRIEAAIPAVPADAGPNDLPNEAGLEVDAISFTKGCYLGQEVMARLKAMGQVRRRLRRVRSARGNAPVLPSPLFADGRQVGEVRSAAGNGAGGWIGLAMISLLALGMSTALALGPNQDHDVLVMDR